MAARECGYTPKGQSYHQWLSGRYGVRKLIEHIWKVIGVASTCSDIDELKQRMEELYAKDRASNLS